MLLHNSETYVKPIEFVVGERQDYCESKENDGTVRAIPVKMTAQFIPFRELLTQSFNRPNIMVQTLNYMSELLKSEYGIRGKERPLMRARNKKAEDFRRHTTYPWFNPSVVHLVYVFHFFYSVDRPTFSSDVSGGRRWTLYKHCSRYN